MGQTENSKAVMAAYPITKTYKPSKFDLKKAYKKEVLKQSTTWYNGLMYMDGYKWASNGYIMFRQTEVYDESMEGNSYAFDGQIYEVKKQQLQEVFNNYAGKSQSEGVSYSIDCVDVYTKIRSYHDSLLAEYDKYLQAKKEELEKEHEGKPREIVDKLIQDQLKGLKGGEPKPKKNKVTFKIGEDILALVYSDIDFLLSYLHHHKIDEIKVCVSPKSTDRVIYASNETTTIFALVAYCNDREFEPNEYEKVVFEIK